MVRELNTLTTSTSSLLTHHLTLRESFQADSEMYNAMIKELVTGAATRFSGAGAGTGSGGRGDMRRSTTMGVASSGAAKTRVNSLPPPGANGRSSPSLSLRGGAAQPCVSCGDACGVEPRLAGVNQWMDQQDSMSTTAGRGSGSTDGKARRQRASEDARKARRALAGGREASVFQSLAKSTPHMLPSLGPSNRKTPLTASHLECQQTGPYWRGSGDGVTRRWTIVRRANLQLRPENPLLPPSHPYDDPLRCLCCCAHAGLPRPVDGSSSARLASSLAGGRLLAAPCLLTELRPP
ncbi:hypothetical protein L1887_57734 [Cichorium endivia]|nr:hypothetical protein L1887_57734 [Cichorium endivia]